MAPEPSDYDPEMMPYRALCGALILALLAVPAAATLCTACISEHCPVRAEAGGTPALPAEAVPPCHGADPGVSNDAPPVAPIAAECCAAATSPGNVPAASPDASLELRCATAISAAAVDSGIRRSGALHEGARLDARSRYSPPLYTLLSTLLI